MEFKWILLVVQQVSHADLLFQEMTRFKVKKRLLNLRGILTGVPNKFEKRNALQKPEMETLRFKPSGSFLILKRSIRARLN